MKISSTLFLVLLMAAVPLLAQSGPAIAVRNGTTDPATCRPASTNIFLNRTSGLLKICDSNDHWTATGGGGGGSGTVTGGTVPSFMTVTGANTATLVFSFNTQAQGLIFAAPCSGSGAVTFRALCAADIPVIAESQVTNLAADLALKAPLASPTFTGTPAAPTATSSDNSTIIATTAFVKAQSYVTATTAPVTSVNSQTGAVALTLPANTTSTSSNWFSAYNSTTGLFTKSQPACADLSNASAMCSSAAYSSLTGTPQLANTIAATASNWLRSYDASTGNFTKSQPAFTDVSGSLAHAQLPALLSGDIPNNAADTTGKSAKTDALNSATTVVNVSSATAPTNGQVLTATGGTAATWQTPSGGISGLTTGTIPKAASATTLADSLLVTRTFGLGIGTPTTADSLADTFFAASATTQKALVVQAKASSTANAFEVQSSAGNKFFGVGNMALNDGCISIGNSNATGGGMLCFTGTPGLRVMNSAGNGWGNAVTTKSVWLTNDGVFAISSGNNPEVGQDTAFSRSTTIAGETDFGTTITAGDKTGTTGAAAYSVYTTNGATAKHTSASESITLSTVGTTTDSAANLLPANSRIDAVACRITTTITTATDWSVGDATIAARFSSANSTLVANTTSIGLNAMDQTGTSGPKQVSAAKLRITTTGTPGAGVIRCTVFATTFTPPSS